jgi:RND family efflux transporter MFP subunit
MRFKLSIPVFTCCLCLTSAGVFFLINATAVEHVAEIQQRVLPAVQVREVWSAEHQVKLKAHGEVVPLESTRIASEVTGRVLYWNPDLLPGGLVKRNTLLFSIEKDAYQAAVLKAEETVANAKARLIEEQARARVATQGIEGIKAVQVSDLYLRRPQLLQAKSAVDAAMADLQLAKKYLANCDVYAPFDALVESRAVGHGQFVSAGEVIANLHNVEYAEIHLPIASFDKPFLPNSNSHPSVDIRDNKGGMRQGVLVRDLGQVDKTTRMLRVAVRIDDPYSLKSEHPVFRFGEFVEVSFSGKSLQDVYLVPQHLVNDSAIWLMDKEERLTSKTVVVLTAKGPDYIVQGDLGNPAQLVMTVPDYPQVGTLVKPQLQSTEMSK